MNSEATCRVAADTESLAAIRAFVRARALALGTSPQQLDGVLVAVDEAATNIMVHGYGERAGMIEIGVERAGADLVVRLRDDAPPFDPTRLSAPNLASPLEERPVGGLGVHLIRQNMDVVTHRVTDRGGNELTLIRQGAIPLREA